MGTNDIHGRLLPVTSEKPDRTIYIGGLSLFSSYLKTLRKTEPNLLWLDAGDLYTGTLESQYFEGETISTALNYLGLDATAPGNHEFDFGLDVYQNRLK